MSDDWHVDPSNKKWQGYKKEKQQLKYHHNVMSLMKGGGLEGERGQVFCSSIPELLFRCKASLKLFLSSSPESIIINGEIYDTCILLSDVTHQLHQQHQHQQQQHQQQQQQHQHQYRLLKLKTTA